MTVLRQRKDGGISECNSPDELVGKGRCCHVLGDSVGEHQLNLNKIQRGMYEVEIGDSKMTINAQKETIKKFFESIPQIDDEKREKIIEFLEED